MKRWISIFGAVVLLLPMRVYAEGNIGNAERLQEIKDRRSIVVTSEQRDIVIQQCQAGKSKIATIQAANESAVKKRLTVYSGIQKEVKAIELRMTKQGADASEVDLFIGKLQQDLDSFSEQARYSQQLAEDITTIDCVATPELYVAATEEYKQARQSVYTSANELKNTIMTAQQQTFKPLVDRLRI